MFAIELAATAFGFLCVVLTIRRNIWCWPVGLVQVLLFIVIFYQAKLYSDLGLHVIYVGLQFYGWYCWSRSEPARSSSDVNLTRPALPVTSLSPLAMSCWVGIAAAGTTLLGWLMSSFTDAAVPYGDAFTTVTSLIAQFLLARKKLESWIFWIAVDIIAVGIYLSKSLIPTSILYLAFLVLAILGYLAWRREFTLSTDSIE